jgi:hypothetical protein
VTNYRRYFAGQLLSTLGTWMQVTAQVWLVLELSRSGTQLGVVSALQFLPILISPYAGVIADKVATGTSCSPPTHLPARSPR